MGEEEKPHIQPKNLLCYYSSFFNDAFTSEFREATEGIIRLPEHSDMTFKMTVQWVDCEFTFRPDTDYLRWLYFGTINIDNLKRTKGDKLNLYIDFIRFADFINLVGPFDSVLQGIRSLLSSRTALLPEHIQTAVQLPYGHPLRSLIAQACVKSYAWSLQLGGRNGGNKRRFRFQEELDTLEGFASDLVRAFSSSIRGNPTFIDPLSKKKYLDPYKLRYHNYQLPQHPEQIPRKRAAPRRVFFLYVL
jgi:hypothetical protein